VEEATFCGYPLKSIRIRGLHPELVTLEETQRLLLSDKQGVKWELRPMLFNERAGSRVPTLLFLYHRDHNPLQKKRHYQGRQASASREGVQKLLAYIETHEQYEKAKLAAKRKRP